MNPFADPTKLNVLFAHVAYQFEPPLAKRRVAFGHRHAANAGETRAKIADADVFVVSGLWNNALLEVAPKLRYVQSIGAGYNQFPLDEMKRRGIRLASARGGNSNAVVEHALSLILGLTRHIPTGRLNQSKHVWRGMLSDAAIREDELAGKTILIIGLGTIGSRLAKLAQAFDLRVLGVRRSGKAEGIAANEVHGPDKLPALIPQADFVVLTCPLTPETTDIINAGALALMKPSAYLVNVARGGCVEEAALLAALREKRIAGAALDCFKTEPLPADSPFWDFENVLITPHTAGETRHYEENVINILVENLARLSRDETELVNQVV